MVGGMKPNSHVCTDYERLYKLAFKRDRRKLFKIRALEKEIERLRVLLLSCGNSPNSK